MPLFTDYASQSGNNLFSGENDFRSSLLRTGTVTMDSGIAGFITLHDYIGATDGLVTLLDPTPPRNFAHTWSSDSGFISITGEGADPPATGAMGKVNRTGLTAAISPAVKLTDGYPSGMYAVYFYMETTTSAVGDGTITLRFTYADDIGSSTQSISSTLALSTSAARVQGDYVLYLASGDITFDTTLTGVRTTSVHAIRIRCTYLG